MIYDISITVQPDDQENSKLISNLIKKELLKKNIKDTPTHSEFIKKSVDARHGKVKIHLKYNVYINEKPSLSKEFVPQWKKANPKKSVIIVGSGPAGLFGALKLLEQGIKPIIVERGSSAIQRKKDIALISTKNLVNEDSNYCFGEGGAGTFSDGKLYTRSNKRGDVNKILNIFVYFGADKKILTDAHPHIGTDKLPYVIKNMREKIIELGGEIYFDTKVVDFIFHSDLADSKQIIGVKTKNTTTNEIKDLYSNKVVLSTGHSATDIYLLLAKHSPSSLEAKTFAAGVRVEHPREYIDSIQYHNNDSKGLGSAEYRVTTQVMERGVYSFCMCPGGFVVPSSSAPDEIVVNGMSSSGRNSKWSNAALVVEIRPEDIPQKFVDLAKQSGCEALSGLFFRASIEQSAKKHGNQQAAPAQLMEDFLQNKKSKSFPTCSYTPGIVSSNLNDWLPSHICERLKIGFKQINQNMKGFISHHALLIAPETRTSTPVRIVRNKETLECISIKGLYPAGEGSGYAGGIVSSAMDGENVCEMIINS